MRPSMDSSAGLRRASAAGALEPRTVLVSKKLATCELQHCSCHIHLAMMRQLLHKTSTVVDTTAPYPPTVLVFKNLALVQATALLPEALLHANRSP